LPSDLSISSFNVLITLTNTTTELYDNNGGGYPVQDSIMLQSPQSCLSQATGVNDTVNLTVVAAVSTVLDIYEKDSYPENFKFYLKIIKIVEIETTPDLANYFLGPQ
jgi:hypothetical protein